MATTVIVGLVAGMAWTFYTVRQERRAETAYTVPAEVLTFEGSWQDHRDCSGRRTAGRSADGPAPSPPTTSTR